MSHVFNLANCRSYIYKVLQLKCKLLSGKMSKDNHDLEFNKISAAVLLAGVFAMLAGFITNVLYHPEDPAHMEKRGYKVEVVEEVQGGAIKEEVDIVALINSADAVRGAKIIKKCVSCHSFQKGGAHKVGPNLFAVVNAKVAGKDGYPYSSALSSVGGNWDYKQLAAFLKSPKKFAKGTKMSFAGIKKPQQLADLIKYLESNR
jgi:cytochrome c